MSGFQRGSGFGTGGAWAPSSIGGDAELELHLLDIEGVDQTVTSGGVVRLIDHSGQAPNNPILNTHALTLDGTADYVDIPFSFGTASEYEINIRFKTSSTGANQILFDCRDASNDGVLLFQNATDNIEFSHLNTDIVSASTYNDGAWHTARVTRVGSTITLYVDGTSVGSDTDATDVDVAGNGRLGTRVFTSPANFFNGQICDFTVSLDGAQKCDIPCCEGIGDTVHDISGNQNHGTATVASEAALWANTQNVYDTLVTDGCAIGTRYSGTGEYYDKTSRLTTTLTECSVGGWIYPTDSGSTRTIAGEWLTTGNQRGWVLYRATDDKIVLNTSDDGTATGAVTSTPTAAANTWTHVAATYSGGTVVIYINGVAVATTGTAKTTLFDTSASFVVGATANPTALWLGQLSGLVIEQAAWTAAQVAALYAGTIPTETGTLWHFRDGDGEDVNRGVSISATGTPDRVPVPSGAGLPVTVGPGVIQPGNVIDLSGGDSGTAHAIALNAALGTLTYTYGDGDIGQNLHIRAKAGGEDRLLVYDPQPTGTDLTEAQAYTA